ncbi:MAG TPA: J domain-containing protein [Sphingomonas sp.]|jgi:DnaJ-domain-containing protein 1
MKWIVAAVVIWIAWTLLTRAKAKPNPERAARRVLGVPAGADADAIRAAHRRLIADAHPDRGGSAEQTRALNAARDLLLPRGG